MRGEYQLLRSSGTTFPELPPRARRIRKANQSSMLLLGTTSACAENTYDALGLKLPKWNYLRVRGEYTTRSGATFVNLELPPRARRIRHPCPTPANHQGTTSACAENTRLSLYHRRSSWNYLRVRGEYRIPPQLRTLRLELPPRARRIRERVVRKRAL